MDTSIKALLRTEMGRNHACRLRLGQWALLVLALLALPCAHAALGRNSGEEESSIAVAVGGCCDMENIEEVTADDFYYNGCVCNRAQPHAGQSALAPLPSFVGR